MIPESTIGSLSVLNCGAGDIRVSLDPSDPMEVARAERIIGDMLKRGYLLFVDQGDGKLVRATGFDPATKEYIIADGPLYPGDADHGASETKKAADNPPVDLPSPPTKARRGKRGPRRIKASTASAVGVAPTAGG